MAFLADGTSLTGWHCKFRPHAEGALGFTVLASVANHEPCHTPLNGLKVRWFSLCWQCCWHQSTFSCRCTVLVFGQALALEDVVEIHDVV
jgi:hypothetical protein